MLQCVWPTRSMAAAGMLPLMAASAALGPSAAIKLNDGNIMPTFGLGVFKAQPGQSTYNAVLCALHNGYRHIDTAGAD
jgi:hypothetical protein